MTPAERRERNRLRGERWRLAEAERLMLRALEIDEANLGPNHPNLAGEDSRS